MLDLQDYIDDIKRHLDDFDFPSATGVADAIISALERGQLEFAPAQVKKLLTLVRGARQFETLSQLAQAFMRAGCDDHTSAGYAPTARRQYAQALIEMSQLSAAIDVLHLGLMTTRTALANTALSADARNSIEDERREMLGLVGRANKQIYVDGVVGVGRRRAAKRLRSFLDTGILHYGSAAEQGEDETDAAHIEARHWPLVNMVATAARRERDGIEGTPLIGNWQAVAGDIERVLTAAVEARPELAQKDPWLLASLGEACVASRKFDKAIAYYGRSCDSDAVDAFQIASAIRQLVEVWNIDPQSSDGGGALVQFLNLRMLEKPGGAMLIGDNASHLLDLVSARRDGLVQQSLIGDNDLEKLALMRTGVDRAGLVAGVYAPNVDKAVGTAFLVTGSDLHPSFGKRPVAVTAAHVVSGAMRAVPFEQAILRFNENLTDAAKAKPAYRCKSVLHLEPAGQLDFTVLEVDELPEAFGTVPVRPPGDIPRDFDRLSPQQRRCWVLGHAEGGEMALALDNSRLLDIGFKPNAPRHADYLRYSASTLPGQSGGPVFDREWHLIGLHQAGINDKLAKSGLRRLGGKPGRHVANEGLSLKTIVETIATAKGGTKTQVAMPSVAAVPATIESLAAALTDPKITDETVAAWFEAPQVQRLVDWPEPSDASEAEKEASRTAAEIVGYGAIVGISQALRYRRNAGFDRRRGSADPAVPTFVSEGDSWFQYPLATVNDTIDHLSQRYPVYCRAIAGMEITNILANTTDVMRAIADKRPSGVLLSGGGNDLLGYGNIKNFVRAAADGAPVEAYLKPRLAIKIADLISLFDEFVDEALRQKPDLKFFIHGYDHARSRNNGRWLRRPLRDQVGIASIERQDQIVAGIVDRFNEALGAFAGTRPGVVHHVDCRGLVTRDEWLDELHPNSDGFGRIADAFDRSIRRAFRKPAAPQPAASSPTAA